MSEQDTAAEQPTTEATETDVTDWKAEAEKWQAMARKSEDRAKSNAAAAKELEKVRAASMTEQEKAVAEARQAATAEATRATAPRLVRAEFRAAAAGRVDPDALTAYLEDVDLAKFIGDDGEPDIKAIEARIERLGGKRTTDFDGGPRTSAPAPKDMNQMLRQAAGRA
ncbi:hypothetical protein [Actinoplanes sp. N902-109]|uniref:hypothetical protein n=1 Tax=Actinoplanes sp. (strain N902-109) TaxID=649831 RepID=UPI0003294AA0|nr:hypothetical protein [Actinoplanes sp. N902-109]AGL13870.1 hypothetical protein L083_0360 [Actinoplanes sp. N902-109]